MDLNSMDQLTKIILSILAIIGIILTGLWKWCPRFFALFRGTKTITFVNDVSAPHENFWHIGSNAGKPALQIACKFMATNLTDHPVALAKATWKGKIKGDVITMLVHVKDIRSQYWGAFDIPPKARTSVSVHFFISPNKMPKKGDIITLSIGVIDQFGNKHWIKNVDFQST